MPSGSYLELKVRTAATNDMSDAAAWTNVTAMTSPGAITPGDKRYVQFQAGLKPDSTGLQTPKLKDVTIKWTGEQMAVDVGGTSTKGPDYGIVGLTVNGEELKSGVIIDLEIFEDTRGYGATKRITSSLTTEITPRNTER